MLKSPHVLEGMSPLMVTQCDDRIGFLNVDVVNKTQMKVQFIDNNGKIADTFEINKGNPVMNILLLEVVYNLKEHVLA